MIKKLALIICCILLFPTIAASQESINYGDWWVGGQVGGVFSTNTDPAFSAGAIVGYNFCWPYRQSWERYFGVALDFQWNQLNNVGWFGWDGNQFALSFLGRAQYPLMGDDSFTRGRLVPFLMAGPAIVWTVPNHFDTTTDFGVVAELGLEYFVIPELSVGPSFRYRHVWIGSQGQDQFMILARLAYHF